MGMEREDYHLDQDWAERIKKAHTDHALQEQIARLSSRLRGREKDRGLSPVLTDELRKLKTTIDLVLDEANFPEILAMGHMKTEDLFRGGTHTYRKACTALLNHGLISTLHIKERFSDPKGKNSKDLSEAVYFQKWDEVRDRRLVRKYGSVCHEALRERLLGANLIDESGLWLV